MSDRGVCYFTLTNSASESVLSHIIDKSSFVIGRSQGADVPVLMAGISREHLRVEIQNHKIVVTDLGSANGTTVDEKAIAPQKPIIITSQNKVQLGTEEVYFQFHLLVRPQEMKSIEALRTEAQSQLGSSLREMEAAFKADLENRKRTLEAESEEMAQKILQRANSEALKITDSAHQEGKHIIDKAMSQSNQMRLKSGEDSQRLIDSAQKQSQEIRQKAQEEVALILEQAQRKVSEQQAFIDEQLDQLSATATKKSLEILSQSEERANQLLAEAAQQARKTKEQATQEGAAIKEKAKDEAMELSRRASARAEEMILGAQKDIAEKMQKRLQEHEINLEEMTRRTRDGLEKETQMRLAENQQHIEQQQKEIIHSFAEEIEKKGLALRSLDSELLDLSHKREVLNKSLESLVRQYDEQATFLDQKQKQLSTTEEIILEKGNALVRLKEAEGRSSEIHQEILKLEQELIRTKKDLEFQKQKSQEEQKNFLNKLIIEQEKKKEELNLEMNQRKLDLLKQVEEEHQKEELRLKQMRRHQITDIARAIEIHLVGQFERLMPKELFQQIPALSSMIYEVVSTQMSDNTNRVEVQTLTQKAEVARKQEKRVYFFKKATAAFAFIVLAVSFVYRSELAIFYNELATSNAAKEFAAERKKRGEFRPEQDEIYRDNYADNVIYFKDYSINKLREERLKEWTQKLSDVDFLTKNGLSEEDIIYFVAAESNMVRRLGEMAAQIDKVYLKEELERIRLAEVEDVERLTRILKSDANFKLVRAKEQEFFQQLRFPASQEK